MGMEPQSTLSGFSVQTNRASCVFVRQKVFCHTKTSLQVLKFLQSRKSQNVVFYINHQYNITRISFNSLL
ncbi:hypothetical protein DW204_14440 [Phocaeicola plebeius]|uniref:Uncharacterized protein n=1 Tax=Phocaeicola plebeius TaxID=310297 RepID=A0A414WQC4_9BACT|nr:hypothetical protein DW204_14440 [Phocaeicola plebeius]